MADPPGGLSAQQRAWLQNVPDIKLPEPTLQVGPRIAPPTLGGDLHLTMPGMPAPPVVPMTPGLPQIVPPYLPSGPVQPATPPLTQAPQASASGPPASGTEGVHVDLGRVNLGLSTDIPAPLPGINPGPPDDPGIKARAEVRIGPVTLGAEGTVDTGGGTQGQGTAGFSF